MRKRVLVTGKNGLVGYALRARLDWGIPNHDFLFVGRTEADLTKENEVESLFKIYKPDIVIHTAAKVGGIGGNINEPAEMFRDNILMNTHLIHHAWKHGVQKFLAFSSVCVFPDGIPILKEEFMQQGEPYHTQFAYGAAKRAVDTQIRAYKKQYGDRQYCSIIPCNIFGVNDYYDLQNAHVIPSLIHKLYLAKHTGVPFVVWGDGSAKREFIFAEDLARIIFKLIGLEKLPERVIVSREQQFTIKEVAEMLCKVANYKGEIVWDTTKPNGQHARPSDLSVLKSLVGEPKYTDMEEALKLAFCWFEMKTLDKSMDYTLRGM
jgi:GDP-L-fucose synthase